MADWFKFYCDELDKEEFIAAWDECPSLPVILIWARAQATKAKDSTFQLRNKYQIVGLCKKLRITEHELQSGLQLLVSIGYIELINETVKILGWDKLQSKYLYEQTRKGKKQITETSTTTHKLPTNYSQTTHIVNTENPQTTLGGEERRGEERRREEKRGGEKEFELLQKHGLADPLLFSFFIELKNLYKDMNISISSPVATVNALKQVLATGDSQEIIKKRLHKAMFDSQYKIKVTQHGFGLLNFCERYFKIRKEFYFPSEPELIKQTESVGIPCPPEIRQAMRQKLGIQPVV
jgi:hypothetical protein